MRELFRSVSNCVYFCESVFCACECMYAWFACGRKGEIERGKYGGGESEETKKEQNRARNPSSPSWPEPTAVVAVEVEAEVAVAEVAAVAVALATVVWVARTGVPAPRQGSSRAARAHALCTISWYYQGCLEVKCE